MAAARVLVSAVLVSVGVAWLFVFGMPHGNRGADLIVVLDGGAARPLGPTPSASSCNRSHQSSC